LCCAQRLSASQRWASERRCFVGEAEPTCSTPFGITEVGIPVTGIDPPGAPSVLNAFRHHRGGHPECREGQNPPGGAQRLSASQRWASGLSCREPFSDSMCSTPFGITEVGITFSRCVLSVVVCAQRLSASQRWACPHSGHVYSLTS